MKYVTLFVAREFDDNSDDFDVFFDAKTAHDHAEYLYHHLTVSERKRISVAVEGYPVEIEDDDVRSAREIYYELCLEDDDAIREASYYKVIE